MTAKLLSKYKQDLQELKLIPSDGGCFELKIDGELIYSKLETGEFPREQTMIDAVGARLRVPAAR